MPGNHPRPPNGPAAEPPDPPDAAQILKGLAATFALAVRVHAETVLAELDLVRADIAKAEPLVRSLLGLSRIATGVHALQAAEDRAKGRADDKTARDAGVRARAARQRDPGAGGSAYSPHGSNDNEGEMDMHAPARNLDDPDVVAAIYQRLERGLGETARYLETKARARRDAGPAAPERPPANGAGQGNGGPDGAQLVHPEPPGPTAA
jgi:hypothetical protein